MCNVRIELGSKYNYKQNYIKPSPSVQLYLLEENTNKGEN